MIPILKIFGIMKPTWKSPIVKTKNKKLERLNNYINGEDIV